MTISRIARTIALTLIGLAQVGCATRHAASGVVQTFDEATGATVVALAEPLIFAVESPQLAVYVRDYVYLGPVEINSGGEKRHYLWVAEWSTIDRDVPAKIADGESELVLLVDGEPMELTQPVSGSRLPRARYAPYSTPVKTAVEHVFELTRQQLVRIAGAQDLLVQAVRPDAVRKYTSWQAKGPPLKAFAHYIKTGDETRLRVDKRGQ